MTHMTMYSMDGSGGFNKTRQAQTRTIILHEFTKPTRLLNKTLHREMICEQARKVPKRT